MMICQCPTTNLFPHSNWYNFVFIIPTDDESQFSSVTQTYDKYNDSFLAEVKDSFLQPSQNGVLMTGHSNKASPRGTISPFKLYE